jgi:hypothetical protein
MANKDAAFGLKAIGKVGQNRDAQGLSEYSIAASSSSNLPTVPLLWRRLVRLKLELLVKCFIGSFERSILY